MALEALHPLGRTIHHILNSPSRISIESYSREILESAHHDVSSTIELLKFIQHVQSDRKKDLDADVKEAARALEDVLDSRVSDVFLGGDHGKEQPLLFSLEMQQQGDIVVFKQKMMNMHKVFNPWCKEEGGKESGIFELKDGYRITRSRFMSWYATKAASIFLGKKEDYFDDLMFLVPDEKEDDDYAVLLTSNFSGNELEYHFSKIKQGLTNWWIDKATSFQLVKEKEEEEDDDFAYDSSNMVGSTQLSRSIRDDLLENLHGFQAVSVVGMAGIGKTDLVMKIIHDPLFSSNFECRIFVRMGPEHEFKDMLRAILTQLNPDGFQMLIDQGDESIKEYLYKTLLVKKYVIVLDDVWNLSVVRELKKIIPTHVAGCLILLTTRIHEIANAVPTVIRVSFLDKEESWNLLREKVFAQEVFPNQLEKAGKKIAENCEGLPLLIVTLADLLSTSHKTLEFWNLVAANKTHQIFVDAYENILEVLYPSYNCLPQHLKTCFLYMGAIPQNCEVRISKLINLWSAEGFLGDSFEDLHYSVRKCFEELVSNYNVALEPQLSSIHNNLKACSLHSVFGICVKESLGMRSFSMS